MKTTTNLTTTNLTDADIAAIRENLGPLNADISLACSAALWGATTQARSGGRRRLARLLAA